MARRKLKNWFKRFWRRSGVPAHAAAGMKYRVACGKGKKRKRTMSLHRKKSAAQRKLKMWQRQGHRGAENCRILKVR